LLALTCLAVFCSAVQLTFLFSIQAQNPNSLPLLENQYLQVRHQRFASLCSTPPVISPGPLFVAICQEDIFGPTSLLCDTHFFLEELGSPFVPFGKAFDFSSFGGFF
jgi:hypothetical protein